MHTCQFLSNFIGVAGHRARQRTHPGRNPTLPLLSQQTKDSQDFRGLKRLTYGDIRTGLIRQLHYIFRGTIVDDGNICSNPVQPPAANFVPNSGRWLISAYQEPALSKQLTDGGNEIRLFCRVLISPNAVPASVYLRTSSSVGLSSRRGSAILCEV